MVGDVVIVHNESLPRGFWKLGHIQNLTVGKNGEARGAAVRFAGKNHRFTTLNQRLRLLYPLEMNHSTASMNVAQETQEPKKQDSLKISTLNSHAFNTSARINEETQRLWTRELQD